MNKSEFLTKLDLTLLDGLTPEGRRRWRLDADLEYYSLKVDLVITVPSGFVTDLESCPRLPFVYWLVGDLVQEPAVLHDFLYCAKLFPRSQCDALLKEASLAMGVSPWQANIIYAGVRVGGHDAYKHHGGTNDC